MTKKKKVSSVLAMTLAAGTIFSAPVYGHAAQQDDIYPSEKQEWAKKVNTEKITGQANQLKSIDKQLVKIEEKLVNYKQEVDSLNLETPAVEEETQEMPDVEETEHQEEYANKLMALENRLNAVNNRLASLAEDAAVQEREEKVEILQIQLNTLIQTVAGEISEEDELEADAPAPSPEEDAVEAPDTPEAETPEGEETIETPVIETPIADQVEDVPEVEGVTDRLDNLENRLGKLEEQIKSQVSPQGAL